MRRMFDPSKPYNQLPELPPKDSLSTPAIYRSLMPVARAIEKLSTVAAALPRPPILSESVILLEAKDSSEIENVITTENDLFAPKDKPVDPMTKEVRNYADALQTGWNRIADRPIDTPLMEEICSRILDRDMHVRRVPGTTLKNSVTGEVVYTPPEGEDRLRGLLSNLFKWLHEDDDIDPIIKAAIGHYQFEAIHPFTDGNGRTGRIFVVLYLAEQGLLRSPSLFLSSAILTHREDYYQSIKEATETNSVTKYLLWSFDVLHEASLLSTVRALNVQWARKHVSSLIADIDQKMLNPNLLDLVSSGPTTTAKDMVEAGIVNSIATAHRWIKKLAVGNDPILEPMGRVNREMVYWNRHVLEALSSEEPFDPGPISRDETEDLPPSAGA